MKNNILKIILISILANKNLIITILNIFKIDL